MVDKKRTRKHYVEELGIFSLNRKDILACEDIIRKHMSSFDKKTRKFYAADKRNSKKNIGKALFSDVFIEYNKSIFGGRGVKIGWMEGSITSGVVCNQSADSIADIPYGEKIPYLRIIGKPGITLEFTPRKTTLQTQRGYAKGSELESMDLTINRIKKRLLKRKRESGLFNKIDLNS